MRRSDAPFRGLQFALVVCALALPFRSAYPQEDKQPDKEPIKKGPFAQRLTEAKRLELVKQFGGNAASEAAVARGLKWLAIHQAPQGHWSLDQFNLHARKSLDDKFYHDDRSTGRGMKNDTAGAAFGLLPFLAVGITHKPRGKAEEDKYVTTVKRGLNWLLQNQTKDGRLGNSTMYEHGLATMALCEAYGMTADPALKNPAQKAVDFIVQAQGPKGGGWRYEPKQEGDMSVTGWQMQALHSAKLAGLKVPEKTLKQAARFLDDCETTDGGGYGYTGPGDIATTSAVGLLCRQYLGVPRRDVNLKHGVQKLKTHFPPKGNNCYFEYYATQMLRHMEGDIWDAWNKGPQGDGKGGVRDMLIKKQDADGSWNPQGDAHGKAGGRIMTTSLSLLTLQVYYRYPPIYKQEIKKD